MGVRALIFLILLILGIGMIISHDCQSQVMRQSVFNTINSSTGLTSPFESSQFNNPASLSRIESNFSSLSCSPSRFNIPELTPSELSFGLVINDHLATGTVFSGLGNTLYNEYTISQALSYKPGGGIYLGISFDYSRISVKGELPDSRLFINAGASLKISELFTAAFTLTNIGRNYYPNEGFSIEQRGSVGIGIAIDSNLVFDLDGLIDINKATGMDAACLYKLNILECRLAVSTYPRSMEGSVGIFIMDNFKIALNLNYNEYLGFSQSEGITFFW